VAQGRILPCIAPFFSQRSKKTFPIRVEGLIFSGCGAGKNPSLHPIHFVFKKQKPAPKG
jgi:hypothetical protein